jgi:hypothetical protein
MAPTSLLDGRLVPPIFGLAAAVETDGHTPQLTATPQWIYGVRVSTARKSHGAACIPVHSDKRSARLAETAALGT